eukprot:SAG31_NODE_14828_length_785_cov_1.546647_1_plen_136_part_10
MISDSSGAQFGFAIRDNAAGVLFGVGLHWFAFVLYAELISMGTKGYNNKTPRTENDDAKGEGNTLAKRLYSAHQNAHEFFCYFGLAVACAASLGVLSGPSADEVAVLAVVAMLARVGHLFFYIVDIAFLRAIAYVV